MAGASTIIAFMRFGQTFTDLLRLGNGAASGTLKGFAQDGLRLVSIAGIGGSVVGRLSRIAVLQQAAGTQTCTWLTTANALRRTGQRFFASLEDLAKTAGVSLPKISASGSTAADVKALIDALKKMAIPVREITPASGSLEEVVRVAQTNRGGVFAFGITFGRGLGHRLYATFSSSAGLVIVDTTGRIYRSIAALAMAYPGASLSTMPQFIIEHAAIITAPENAAASAGLSSIALELSSITSGPKISNPPRANTR